MSSGTVDVRKQGSLVALLPALIFVITLSLTVGAALITRRSLDEAARARLEALAGPTADRLGDRFLNAAAVARGTAGLFTAEGRVSADSFHRYVNAQSIERWFAHGHVSWVAAIAPEDEAVVLAQARRDRADYAFKSPHPRFPVVFVFPRDEENERALGIDLAELPDRLAALERARDRGELQIIHHVQQKLDPDHPGSAVFYPVFTGPPAPQTLEERRAQFRGVVIVSTATDAVMENAFGPALPYFHVEVFDRADGERLIWRSPGFPSVAKEPGLRRALDVGDATLEVHVVPRESFAEPAERYAVLVMLVVGTLLALAASGLTFQQLRARRAAEIAQAATRLALDENDRRRALLDSVVAQSSDGIVMADDSGRVLLFNQAAADLLGIKRDEAPATAAELRFLTVEGQLISAWETPLARAIRGELVRDARWLIHRPDGEQRALSGTASPLRAPDRTGTGGLLVMRDETNRLRAEADRERLIAALEFSNAELEQFASVASHDLKAPLRGIAQLAQWLEDDLGEGLSDENRQHFHLLQGRVRRLTALIDGILGYARAGQSSQTLDTFDARAAAAEALQLLSAPAGALIDLPKEGVTLHGDKALLTQVLMNLLSNAFKHGDPTQATVHVEAEAQGDFVRFSVRDNGPGIAPEYHQRIWGMFQTLSPRDEKESTGIGLAVVRKLVQAQGGRTWLESAVGQGATFFFTWPRHVGRIRA